MHCTALCYIAYAGAGLAAHGLRAGGRVRVLHLWLEAERGDTLHGLTAVLLMDQVGPAIKQYLE